MADVAQRAGVSLVTVSRTIHHPDLVVEKTRRKVLRAITETGYVQNLVAGSLASKRTNVIAAIVPTLNNLAYGMSLHAVGEVLRKSGYHLLLGTDNFSAGEEESLIATFLGWRPDGIFLHRCRHTPAAVRLMRNAGIPVVETGDLTPRPLDMVVSYSNQEIAAKLAPSLTTVRVPREEIGYRAGGMLLDRVHGRAVKFRSVDVGFQIVDRDSA